MYCVKLPTCVTWNWQKLQKSCRVQNVKSKFVIQSNVFVSNSCDFFSLINVFVSFFCVSKKINKKHKFNTNLLNKHFWGSQNQKFANQFDRQCVNKIKHLVFTALWRLRLVRTLLSLSTTIERLTWLRLPVCAAASRRHGNHKLASGSSRLHIIITQTLHTTTKTINVCQQWPTVF